MAKSLKVSLKLAMPHPSKQSIVIPQRYMKQKETTTRTFKIKGHPPDVKPFGTWCQAVLICLGTCHVHMLIDQGWIIKVLLPFCGYLSNISNPIQMYSVPLEGAPCMQDTCFHVSESWPFPLHPSASSLNQLWGFLQGSEDQAVERLILTAQSSIACSQRGSHS